MLARLWGEVLLANYACFLLRMIIPLPPLPLAACRFRQVALTALARNMQPGDGDGQQLSDLRRVFQEMDSDADGKVTYAQVRLGGGGCV